jgi:tetratricopeptide (TPR) repeat protein
VATLFELLMLWLMLAVTVAMVVLSARARRLEDEEGLTPSRKRLIAVSLVCGAAALLVAGATASAILPARAAATLDRASSPEPTDPATIAKREAIEKRKADLYDEIRRLNAELAQLSPAEEAPAETGTPSRWSGLDIGPWAHFLVPLLVMIGTVALVTLGDPTTLFRSGSLGGKDEDIDEKQRVLGNLDRLSHLAEQAQYREGLEVADAIDAGLLERFDRLDWAFLKSYCAVQLAATAPAEDAGEHKTLLETAARDLETLLEQAPNRGEAVYLAATAHGLLGDRAKALEGFERAATLLPRQSSKLPFAHNESVCLLGLAEEALGKGDAARASQLFDQVTKRGVLVDQVPLSLVKVRLLNVRRSLREGNHEEAAKGIEAVRKLEGLEADQRRGIETICDALETLMAVRQGDPPAILHHTDEFLSRHLPRGLPEPDEEIVEEYLESPVAGMDLPLSPQIFRAFLFLQAEARSKIAAKAGTPPTADQTAAMTRPLFRALQFELRQRDILATLGGLYFWFVPDGRKKALQWLEAAAAMGAEGRIARRLLEAARADEREHREAMDWFRSASSRFLHDPTLAASVRQALIEELGRFREFQPLLIDLQSTAELEPREPTLRLLRERAGYLEKAVSELAARKAGELAPKVQELLADYRRVVAGLDTSTGRINELERKLVQEFGNLLIS